MKQLKVKDIREEFVKKLINEDFIIDKFGGRVIEIIGATFKVNKDLIFGAVNEDYVKRELEWYESQSLYVQDIPGDTPKIWEAVANKNGEINSNYGWCIFSNDNYHQYEKVLDKLLKNTLDRQAVMIYTRPSMHEDSKYLGMSDFMCFTGDTLVLSPEGDMSIKDLVENINKNGRYPVYSVNFNTEEREIKYAIRGEKTGTKEILRVYFDNGKYIDTTEDHKFYVKDRVHDGKSYYYNYENEVKAKDLKPGMSMIKSLIYNNGNSHLRFKKPLRGEYNYKNSEIVHREYYKFITNENIDDFEIHHINENSKDNSFNNLEKLTKTEHQRIHQTGENNSVHKIKDRTEQLEKMVKTLKITTSNRDLSWYEKSNNIDIDTVIDNFILFTTDRKDNRFKVSSRAYERYCKLNNIQNYYTLLSHYRRLTKLTLDDIFYQNCKVERIEYLNKTEDVYDIEVEDNHNFFVGWKNEITGVGEGVLVHNCTNTVQYFIRNNKLSCVVQMRSNDAWAGYRNDVAWQKYVLENLYKDLIRDYPKLKIGDIYWNVGSLHVYDRQFYLVEYYAKTGETSITKEKFKELYPNSRYI